MIFNFKQFINESFQDDLTDSSNFRSWFGNSIIIDELGKPKIVYHGSPSKDINIFDISAKPINRTNNYAGFYFSPSRVTHELLAIIVSETNFGLRFGKLEVVKAEVCKAHSGNFRCEESLLAAVSVREVFASRLVASPVQAAEAEDGFKDVALRVASSGLEGLLPQKFATFSQYLKVILFF